MDIEDFVKVDAKAENGQLNIYFTALAEATDLRIMKFLSQCEKLFNDLKHPKIKRFYFIFDLDSFTIPSNFNMLKECTEFFEKHSDLLNEKLEFSVFKCKNNVFKLFFGLFKKYYEPVKSLYLCKTLEDVNICLYDEEGRKQFPNICTMLKNE